jgi:hypothetical protein
MGFFERKTRLYIRDNTCGLRLALHMVKCTKLMQYGMKQMQYASNIKTGVVKPWSSSILGV